MEGGVAHARGVVAVEAAADESLQAGGNASIRTAPPARMSSVTRWPKSIDMPTRQVAIEAGVNESFDGFLPTTGTTYRQLQNSFSVR